MVCKHLNRSKKAGAIGMCSASITRMMPNIQEMFRFCTTAKYRRCPIFMSHIDMKHKTMKHKTEAQQKNIM